MNLNHQAEAALDSYKALLVQKRYSKNTFFTYTNYFQAFLIDIGNSDPEGFDVMRINRYILHLIKTKNISNSKQNQIINAIKFNYEKVLGMEKMIVEIQRPKKEYMLPNVLSSDEIQSILNCISNYKHRSMIDLIYSSGLRRSELINLKITDIDSDRMLIKINQSY